MTIAEQLQKFLELKFDKLSLKRKDFIEGSGVSMTTTSQLLNADLRNPDFNTILKTANYFNCSLDEVIGRNKSPLPETNNYQDISSDQINKTLKSFIGQKLQETGLNQYQLSKKLGFSSLVIYRFMQEHKSQEKLSSAVIISMADYFNVPLDEMIGRTPTAPQNAQMVDKDQVIPSAVQKLSTKDMESLKQIKSNLSSTQQKATIPSPHSAKKAAKAKDTLPSR